MLLLFDPGRLLHLAGAPRHATPALQGTGGGRKEQEDQASWGSVLLKVLIMYVTEVFAMRTEHAKVYRWHRSARIAKSLNPCPNAQGAPEHKGANLHADEVYCLKLKSEGIGREMPIPAPESSFSKLLKLWPWPGAYPLNPW